MQPDRPSQPPAQSGKIRRFYYGYVIVAAIFLILMVSWGTYSIFGVFFNPLITEFGWTRAAISGAFSVSTVVQGMLGIVVGSLTDRVGPRLVVSVCGVLLGLGYLLMSQVSSLWHVYLFYGLIIGAGMSGIWVPLLATVSRWFIKRRSLMSGIVIGGIGIGSTIAPPVFSRFIAEYGWRISYLILGGTVLIFTVLVAQLLRSDPASVRQMPDGRPFIDQPPKETPVAGISLKEILKTGRFWLLFIMVFCFGFCMFAIRVHIVPHAIDTGIDAFNAANVLAFSGITGILGNFVFGGLGDAIGNRKVFILGFAVTAASMIWLLFSSDLWMLYIFAAAFGFTFGMGAVESPLVVDMFGLSSPGLIIGVVSLAYTTGAAVGPLAAGYLFDLTGSYQPAFLLAAGLAVAGIILATLIRTS